MTVDPLIIILIVEFTLARDKCFLIVLCIKHSLIRP